MSKKEKKLLLEFLSFFIPCFEKIFVPSSNINDFLLIDKKKLLITETKFPTIICLKLMKKFPFNNEKTDTECTYII